ncbi:hypothetical protein [Actinocorallia herbida]|nr:hypothetical protein [Actinocorallia herbida]
MPSGLFFQVIAELSRTRARRPWWMDRAPSATGGVHVPAFATGRLP